MNKLKGHRSPCHPMRKDNLRGKELKYHDGEGGVRGKARREETGKLTPWQ